jgi:hypothetical protein
MAQASSSSPDKRSRSIENEPIEAATITCTICDAVFAPSPMYQSFVQMSAATLENVFTSVCHFCFRCRRLACPECWDTLHSVCGACAQEVNLPFRAETVPLDGAIFSPSRRADTSHAHPSTSTLVCIHRGRFQIDTASSPKSSPAASKLSANLPRQLISTSTTGSSPTKKPGKDTHAAAAVYYIPIVPLDAQEPTQEEEPTPPFKSFIKAVERTMTAIVFTILLIIVLLIILAEFSSTANLQIIRLVHIDIRGEIAYLTYLVRQLHW